MSGDPASQVVAFLPPAGKAVVFVLPDVPKIKDFATAGPQPYDTVHEAAFNRALKAWREVALAAFSKEDT